MPARIDALADQGSRRRLFASSLLDTTADDALQALVDEAARATATLIALVSLILDRIQLFRAHRGLPPDLEAAGATDRDASFCQFVVRDEQVFEVNDAPRDSRVPQALVDSHGIRAYLGAPLRVQGEVLGSLCVIDAESRTFSDAERASLVDVAARVNARLEEMAADSRQRRHSLQLQATQPVFGEVRNQLMVMTGCIDEALYEHAQLAPVARLSEDPNWSASVPLLRQAAGAVQALGASLVDADAATDGVARSIDSLQAVLDDREDTAELSRVVRLAEVSSHHITKLVGGVTTPTQDIRAPLTVRAAPATAAVSATLSAVAARMLDRPDAIGPILLEAEVDVDTGSVWISAPGFDEADAVARELGPLVAGQPGMTLGADGPRVVVVLERAF